MKRIMVCIAEDGGDAVRISQLMEDNDAIVFSITCSTTAQELGGFLVFSKVRDGLHEQRVFDAIDKADTELHRQRVVRKLQA
jgi:hypothetical protein